MNSAFNVQHFITGCLSDVVNDDERPYLLLFSASTIIVHQIIHMVANAFNKS